MSEIPPLSAYLREARERFEAHVASIRPDLHRYCARMTGSVLDGEDLVQETLTQAFYGLSLLRGEVAMRPWLFGIAHHKCVDFLRSRTTRAAVPFDEENDAVPTDAEAEAEIEARDHAARVFTSLVLTLPPRERASVILKDVLGYELSETAAIVGTSVGGVKAALHRAREKLARLEREPNRVATAPTPLAQRYIELFNRRDWDALGTLLEQDVRCELVGHAQLDGRAALAGNYLGTYATVSFTWRMVAGELDGEPVLVCLKRDRDVWVPRHVVRLFWKGVRVARIRDYAHVPYLLRDGALVLSDEDQGRR